MLSGYVLVILFSLFLVPYSAYALEVDQNTIDLSKANPTYLEITGELNNFQKNTRLVLTVVSPDGSEIDYDIRAYGNGQFSTTLSITDEEWDYGKYVVYGKYGETDLGMVSFVIEAPYDPRIQTNTPTSETIEEPVIEETILEEQEKIIDSEPKGTEKISSPSNNVVTFDLPLGIEVKNIKRLELASSDLIVLDLEVKNVGNKPHLLHSNNLVLADSKSRIYVIVSSFELSNQDEIKNFWNVDCDFILYDSIQAGIKEKFDDLCFQVPSERNLEYFLIFAESNYEWCSNSNPYLQERCGVIPLGTISLTPKTEKSPSSSPSSSSEGGCLIATASYGTRNRENKITKTYPLSIYCYYFC